MFLPSRGVDGGLNGRLGMKGCTLDEEDLFCADDYRIRLRGLQWHCRHLFTRLWRFLHGVMKMGGRVRGMDRIGVFWVHFGVQVFVFSLFPWVFGCGFFSSLLLWFRIFYGFWLRMMMMRGEVAEDSWCQTDQMMR